MASKTVAEKVRAALNDLLTVVDENMIITLDAKIGTIYIGGQRAEPSRLANLKSEAEFLLNSDLWNILYETPKELAQRAIFVNGETLDDLKKGRSMLYVLSSQKRILDILKSYVPPVIPKTSTGQIKSDIM